MTISNYISSFEIIVFIFKFKPSLDKTAGSNQYALK